MVCPVVIRGVNYPSQSAAARALGVAQTNISKALDLGTVDNVGLGRNQNKRACFLNDKEFESRAELARYVGVSASTLRSRISSAERDGLLVVVVPQGVITWKET